MTTSNKIVANLQIASLVANMKGRFTTDNLISLQINSNKILALIDTGASISVISQQFAERLKLSVKAAPQAYLIDAGNQVLQTCGIAEISVNLNGLIIPFTFTVIPTLCNEVILGVDFLTETQAIIDMPAKAVAFYDNLVILRLLNHFVANNNIARVAESIVLKPSSETRVKVTVPFNVQNAIFQLHDVLLFESLPCTQNTNFVVSRSIAKITAKVTPIKVLNLTNAKIKLRKFQSMATISTINASTLTPLPKDDLNNGHNLDDLNNVSYVNMPPSTCTSINLTVKPGVHEAASNLPSDLLPSSSSTIDSNALPDVLKDLKIKINDKLTTSQRERLINLLVKNNNVFSRGLHDLPGTDIYIHHIDVKPGVKPIRCQPYKATPGNNVEIQRQIDELVDNGIIYPSTSMWASPCLLVTKQNGDRRLVFDYRKINDVISKLSYPVASPDQIFDSIAEQKARIFSVLDMKSSYTQIKLDDESQEITAFVTQNGKYAFRRCPFGLSHSGSVFVSVITQLFRQNNFQNLNSYVDDLIVYSRDFSSHLEHLEYVFKTLNSVNLKLNAEKCDLCLPEVNYLGMTISANGVAINQKKVTIVKNYPRPQNVKQVRQFLGFVNFFRKFICKYSIIVHPLNLLLRRDVVFDWCHACEVAFETLKAALINPPVLAHPDLSKQFILTTDASTTSIAWTLSQLDDELKERAILYGGRSLRDAELNWDVTSLEGIALVSAIKACHHYLADNNFIVYTDHESLINLRDTKNKHGRLFRWAILLQEYTFQVKHKAGKLNHVDGLSRIEYPPEPPNEQLLRQNDDEYDKIRIIAANRDYKNQTRYSDSTVCDDENDFVNIQDHVELQLIYNEFETNGDFKIVDNARLAAIIDIATAQRQDPQLKRFFDFIENSILPENDVIARKTVIECQHYFTHDNILYHVYLPRNVNTELHRNLHEQIVIPSNMKNEILKSFHDDFAHAGFDRMYASIRTRYYWPTIYNDVHSYTSTCEICQKNKRQYHATKAPLCPLPVEDVFARVHLDIIGILPESGDNKYKYILIVADSFSKWIEAYPLKTQTSVEIAEVLFREYFSRYGFPLQIVTDRGANLISRIMQQLCKFCKITRMATSAFHQSANSMAERNIGTLIAAVRCYITSQHDWYNVLPSILMALRATVCTQSTEFSPYEVLFGRIMRTSTDILFAPETGYKDVDEYIMQLIPRLQLVRDVAKANCEAHQDYYKKIYDRNAKEGTLAIGSKHWLFMPQAKKGVNKKLRNIYAGPFYIVEQTSDTNYKIRDVKTNKMLIYSVHRSRLKKCDNFRDVFESDELRSFDFNDDTQMLKTPVAEDRVNDGEPCLSNTTRTPRPESPQPSTSRQNDDVENEDALSQLTQEYDVSDALAQPPLNVAWMDARELVSVKTENRRKFYKVLWKDKTHKPSWILESDVPDRLKQMFYIKRTREGKIRKTWKRLKRENA